MRADDAAIVGMGAVFPGAPDLETYWRNIVAGVDSVTDVPPNRWDPEVYYAPDAPPAADRFYCRRGGFVDELATFDPIRFGVMPTVVDETEPDQLLALRVTAEAVEDAGGEAKLPDRSRIGVVVGRGGYMGVATARLDTRVRTAHQLAATLRELAPELDEARVAEIRSAFQAALGPDRPDAAIGLVPSFTAARIANRLDFGGPAYTVDAACASSLLAVEHAVAELTSRRCDLVLAGAVHHTHIATLWSVFTQLRALSPSEHIRPFDRTADGTLISEGSGVVALKRLADAERDGDRIYAVIRGTGVASDGRASSLMSPLVDGQVRALERAWRAAGLDPTQPGAIGLLEAHGTGTPVGDEAELATLAKVFGPPLHGERPVGLGTVKSMIGHTMQASGIAGLIKAALAVHHRTLPPTLHVSDPHPGFAETRMRPLGEAEPWEGSTPRRAAVNAFGFGGINSHVILQEPPGAVVAVRESEDARVVRLAADSVEELADRLRAGDLQRVGQGACRLAIVDPTPKRLALAAKVLARGKPWRGRGEVWFTPSPLLGAGGGRIAFLFPGLEPDFAPRLSDVAARFTLPEPALTGGDDLIERALDVIATGRMLAEVLDRMGIGADLLAGHSLGEWTAMMVGGMYPVSATEPFLDSLRPGALAVPDLVYAAVGCGAERAGSVLAEAGSAAVVSHDNCPHQSVICGSQAEVAAALDSFAAEGVLAQELPFRSGFHTPMWRPYLDQIRAAFTRLPLQPPRVPVWSGTTCAPFPPGDEQVRDLVVRHLLEPVRFRTLISRLHSEGVRAFVQLGPGSLTGFVDDTLRDGDVLTVSAADSARGGLAQLRRMAAALWVEGAEPCWETVEDVRRPAGRPIRLALGSPLVRMGETAPRLRAPSRAPSRSRDDRGHPVLAAFNAALDDLDSAAHTVTGAWERTATPTRRTFQRTFSLADMPYVIDHCVYLQPDDWPDDSDRFPVVPMTTQLEVMAEAARDLLPGLVVTGFDDVRALRWLPVAPAATAEVVAVVDGPGVVRVTISGYCSATVRLAPSYDPPPPARPALTAEETPPVTAAALYHDRWMFHGPAFAGVADLHGITADGIRGELEALSAPGALLDAAGQLFGHWMQVRLPADRLVFPVSIERVRLYGPPPRTGARMPATARTHAVTDTTVRGEVEVRGGDGRVWARLEGWTYRRFATDERVWPMKFTPETSAVGEPQPGGWCLARRRWPDTSSRELVMRRYLAAAERADYERVPPRERDRWLLGRIAAKDAVRQRLWEAAHGPVFPAEVQVGGDPVSVRTAPSPTAVSVAADAEIAVGLAGPPGVGVGLAEGDAAAAAVRAVAEARRTSGRPDAPAIVVSAEGTRLTVACAGHEYTVETTRLTFDTAHDTTTYAIAWTGDLA